jgi:hypothetical protein
LFGFSVPLAAPEAGEASSNLKVVSEEWSDKGDRARLLVSGRPGTAYRIDLFGGDRLATIEGAELSPDRGFMIVRIPAGESQDYRTHTIDLVMKPI